MPLPDFPTVTDDTLRSIASRHRLDVASFSRLPQIGIFNAIYALGDDLILRVPRDHPRFIGAARNETIAVPLAKAAGVRTPALLVFDDAADILPVPYSIYERVEGAALEQSIGDSAHTTGAWNELGRDLALLHRGVAQCAPATELIIHDQKSDPRPVPEIIARAGYFTSVEADWLTAWLDRLAPYATEALPQRFLHGDTQATNVMVEPQSLTYRAVIDWGNCRWGDIAIDFSGIALRSVPALLEGYREVAGSDDNTMEARILWEHLKIALHQLRGQPQPECSWAERPIGMLLEILRFFLEEPDVRWRQWSPPRMRS